MSNELSTQEQTYLPSQFAPGQTIQGRYELLHLIGAGGVCFVMAARHSGFDDLVALKFLQPEFANNTEAVSRFTIEARTCFKLRSAHIVRVFDVGMHAGAPFLAMELLEGEDLRSYLARQSATVATHYAVDLILQTCEALSVAHSMGVIHRDIKPENLFLTSIEGPDHIKVLDFGISKVALVDGLTKLPISAQLTQIAVGTPPYMSPEQVRSSRDLDARADIWSVGCVLYELLTGQSPFKRESVMQSCAAVLEQDPAPPHELNSSIPLELSLTVMRCLRKQPAERYPDVAELAEALRDFGSGRYVTYVSRCRANLSHDHAVRRSTNPAGAFGRRSPTGGGFASTAGHEVSNVPLPNSTNSNSGLHPVSSQHPTFSRTGGYAGQAPVIIQRTPSSLGFDSQTDDRPLEYSRSGHPASGQPTTRSTTQPPQRGSSRVAVGLIVIAAAAGVALYSPDGTLARWLSQFVRAAHGSQAQQPLLRPAEVAHPTTQVTQQPPHTETQDPAQSEHSERALPNGLAHPSSATHSGAPTIPENPADGEPEAASDAGFAAASQVPGTKSKTKKSRLGKNRREDSAEAQLPSTVSGAGGDLVDVGF